MSEFITNAELRIEAERLVEENIKLRELVKHCMLNDGCCEDCYADNGECPVKHHMRELGIKEDG